jgi:hypothetical protein
MSERKMAISFESACTSNEKLVALANRHHLRKAITITPYVADPNCDSMPAQFLPAPGRWVLYLIARGGQSEFVRHESLRMWLAGDVYLQMNIMEVSRIWLDPFQALLGYSGFHCQFGP